MSNTATILFVISNNLTTIVVSIFGFLVVALPSVLSYLTYKRATETKDIATKIEKNTNGLVSALVKGKDETSEAKQGLSKAEGKAEGIAEKQVEVDQLNKDSQPKT